MRFEAGVQPERSVSTLKVQPAPASLIPGNGDPSSPQRRKALKTNPVFVPRQFPTTQGAYSVFGHSLVARSLVWFPAFGPGAATSTSTQEETSPSGFSHFAVGVLVGADQTDPEAGRHQQVPTHTPVCLVAPPK